MNKWTMLVGLVAFLSVTTVPPATLVAQQQAATKTCILKVTGMTCAGCATAVKLAAKKVDGVKDANVSYERGIAEVTYDPAKTAPETIAKGVTEKTGFKSTVQPRK